MRMDSRRLQDTERKETRRTLAARAAPGDHEVVKAHARALAAAPASPQESVAAPLDTGEAAQRGAVEEEAAWATGPRTSAYLADPREACRGH